MPKTPAPAVAKRFSQKGVGCLLLRGRVRVTTHNDDGSVIEDVVLCYEEGRYGVNIPKGVWHTIEAMESNSVIFGCKEGPFVEHEVDGILEVKSENERASKRCVAIW